MSPYEELGTLGSLKELFWRFGSPFIYLIVVLYSIFIFIAFRDPDFFFGCRFPARMKMEIRSDSKNEIIRDIHSDS